MHGTPDQKAESPELLDLFFPLHFFYSSAGKPLPEVGFSDGEELPEPYRHLLVHESDMTSRLREHHDGELRLRIMQMQESEDYLVRMVLLEVGDSGKPVEFGAIGIHLEPFPPKARKRILAGVTPLGAILELEKVAYVSKPRGYFGVIADDTISAALDTKPGQLLYGRCNVLTTLDGLTMADVVEILPPSEVK